MFSKLTRRKFLRGCLHFSCGIFLLISTGCSPPLGETPPVQKPPESAVTEQTKCLLGIVPEFERYFEGSATQAQVQATWNCLGNVVSLFDKFIRGSQEDRFTPRELAHFVEQYFLDNQKISDATMVEAFRVKQLLVGGANDSISRLEMGRLLVVIKRIGLIAEGLNPYMKVYSFNWKIQGGASLDADLKYFDDANLQIQQAAKDLGALIEKNGQAYRIANLISLLKELSQYSKSGEWPWLKTLEEALPLVHKLKKALTDGDETTIEPTEWRRFALLGGRGYIQYLRYFYFIKAIDSIGNGPELVFVTRSINDLFSFLGDMVDGTKDKSLSRLELLEILQALTQFVPSLKISDAFLIEIMKIKCLFFGGGIDYFEKADFDRAQEKLHQFEDLTARFLSYANVYGFSWDHSQLTGEDALLYFQAAENNLVEFAIRLGETMEGRYDLKDLVRLGNEYDFLYPHVDEDNKKDLRQLLQQWVPVIISVKNILFSDEDSLVGEVPSWKRKNSPSLTRNEWSEFLELCSQLYSRYAFYHYFMQDQELLHGNGLTNLEEFARDLIEFLNSLIEHKPAQSVSQISFQELRGVLMSLKAAEFLPKQVSEKSLENLIRVLVQKVLIDPKSRLSGVLPQGLTRNGVGQLKSEFLIWLENQKYLEVVYQGVPAQNGKTGKAILADLNRATSTVGLEELKAVYDAPVSLAFDLEGRLYLKQPGSPYLRKTSDIVNLVRSAVRLLFRSYAMDERRTVSLSGGLNLAEANAFFVDIRNPLVELGILNPKNSDFMTNRFREANLFTGSANGDEYLNFKEGAGLGLMAISGLKIDSLFYQKLETVCPVSKPTEMRYDWTLGLSCVQDFYQREILGPFSSMPDFNQFLTTLSPERFQAIFLNLLKAAGFKNKGDGQIRVEDLALFPHATQYVEMAYQKYDTDRDGYLSTAEVMVAYPTFRNILKEGAAGKLESDTNLRALLAWLLRYESAPSNVGEYLKFFVWWVPKGEKGWNIRADREKFIKVLGVMSESVSNKSAPKLIFNEFSSLQRQLGDTFPFNLGEKEIHRLKEDWPD